MTIAPDELAETEADEAFADDLADDIAGPSMESNHGQVATRVGRDMVQTVNNWLGHYRAAQELSDDFVRETMATFVDRVYRGPGTRGPELSRMHAAELLKQWQCVLLVGDPESGRRTAAVGLLNEIPLPRREIPIDDDAQRLIPVAEVAWSAFPPSAYLLAVPANSQDGKLRERLVAYQEAARRHESYLVVLISEDDRAALGSLTGFGVLGVEPPDPRGLLRKHLEDLQNLLDVDALLDMPPLPTVLAGATPQRINRLSQRIHAAAYAVLDQDLPDPVKEIATEAFQAFEAWDKELFEWFDQHPDARTRLFLIATAFLEGRPAADVLHAAEKLAEELREPADVRGGIDAPGIRQLADRIIARLDDQRRIYFKRPAYGIAVLGYVHGDRSNAFRARLWAWAADLPIARRGVPSRRVAGEVADAMLAMVLALPAPDRPNIHGVAERWWGYQTLQPLVVDLITAIAMSPEAGRDMRRRLNEWAVKSPRVALLGAVAAVCAGPLADAYPRAVLTRLNNLAGRGIEEATDEVVKAMTVLWERPLHRRAVLSQAIAWVCGQDQRRDAGMRSLAAITGSPERAGALLLTLSEDTEMQESLVQALAALFTEDGPRGSLRTAMFSWLEVAAGDPRFEDLMAGLMIRSAGTTPGASWRLAQMNKLVFEWQPVAGDRERPDARDLRDRLSERIVNADPLTRASSVTNPVVSHG